MIELDLVLWLLARATGLAAFVALAISVLSGIALRTSVLRAVASDRAWLELHSFSTALWLPLGGTHVLTLLADRTAEIAPADLVVPFGVGYGRLAIGLGTIALDLVVVVTVTAWVRRSLPRDLWTWIHRSSYAAMGLTFAHAILSGTDFSAPTVSAVAWSIAFALLVLAAARAIWGRLPA